MAGGLRSRRPVARRRLPWTATRHWRAKVPIQSTMGTILPLHLSLRILQTTVRPLTNFWSALEVELEVKN
jgi:hypothetical protein